MAQRPQPSLRLADGGSFITRWAQSVMRPNATANRLREADAPPPPPAAPVRAPPPPPPNPNATPDNPAGIRFQDGGHVPGTGRGDKIPAKYEPGEFVVSNDMIDDNPGLREQLSGLRAETLAARGKTVEEADAKALNGGRRPSLRAQAGFNGSADPDFWRGNPNPLQGNQANQTLLDAARQRTDPVQSAAAQAANARAAPPTPTPPAGPTNPGMANPQARAAYADMARGAAPTSAPIEPAAPKAPGAASKWFGAADDWKGMAGSQAGSLKPAPPEVPGRVAKGFGALQGAAGAYDAYQGIQEGDAWKAGVGAADAVAGAALFTPAAPIAGAYLGVRGAYDTAKAAGGAIYNNLSEGARDVVGGTVNQIGLNTGLWGTDDSAKMQMDAAAPTTLRKTAPGAPTQTRPEDTFAGPPAAAAGAASPATDPGAPRRVDRPGQSPLFTNVADDAPYIGNNALMARGNGPNAQNMAAANNLAATDSLRSQGAALGGQPAGGSGIPAMPQTLHSGNDWASRKNLENLRTSAGSIYDSQSQWGDKAKAAADVSAFQNAQAMDTAARTGSDPGSVSRNSAQASMFGSKTAADASRYGSDNSLRGQMYSSDAQLGAKRMEMQRGLQQQQLKGAIFREAGGKPEVAAQIAASYGLDPKDFTDMASASQTRDHNATTNARKRLEGMAVRSDDKGGTVVDPGRLARLESTLGKMAPGWQHMSEPEQAKHLATAEASVNLLEGLNDRRNNSFWQSIGVDGSSASLDKLPIEAMKGGRLKTVKALEGAFTGGGVERKDYVIETEGGHKLYLPRDKVNQGELELLKSRGVDISSLQK